MTSRLQFRCGASPQTSDEGPHRQLTDRSAPTLWGELIQRVFSLPGVVEVHSQVSPASSRAVMLEDQTETLHPSTSLSYADPVEPVHVHGVDDTSLHMCLPTDRAAEVVTAGWGEMHQFGDHGTELMVYGPRDDIELDLVIGLVAEAITFAGTGV